MRKNLGRLIWGVALLLLGGCCGPDLVSHDEIRGQDIRPYVGLVRNLADVDISIPSANSNATVIVPARRSLELTVWEPQAKIFGYVDGKEVFCQSITVRPKQYSQFCKKYDFLVEMFTEPPPSDLPASTPDRFRNRPRSDSRSPGNPTLKQLSWQQD